MGAAADGNDKSSRNFGLNDILLWSGLRPVLSGVPRSDSQLRTEVYHSFEILKMLLVSA